MKPIVIDGVMTKIGYCENCELTGILRYKPMVHVPLEMALTEIPDAQTMRLCVTCFETPTGRESENLRPID